MELCASVLRRNWRAELATRWAPALMCLTSSQRAQALVRFDLDTEYDRRHTRRQGAFRAQLICPGLPRGPGDEALQHTLIQALVATKLPADVRAHRPWCASTADAVTPLQSAVDVANELRVSFDTPFVYSNQPEACLTTELFIDLVQARHRQLFADHLRLPDDRHSLLVLPHYGHPYGGNERPEVGPSAVPAPRLRGAVFCGNLFLRNPSPTLVKTLRELQNVHLIAKEAASRLEWRGRFQLSWLRGPWLDRDLLHPRRLLLAAQRVLEREDTQPSQGPAGQVLTPGACADDLLRRIQSAKGYVPACTQGFELHRSGHAPRVVERLETSDLIAQQRALDVLAPVAERQFDPRSFGFRRGLGREDAVRAVRSALREGFTHVVETDVAHCFMNLDHAQVDAAVDGLLLRSDIHLRALLHHAIRQPTKFDGQMRQRLSGLAQGAPLSPVLANLVLTAVDQGMDTERVRYLRFADDMVVLARNRGDALQALQQLRQLLAGLGLAVAEPKTRLVTLQEGFRFLGEQFTPQSVEPVEAAVAAQRKPLLVTEPYLQLGVNGAALQARRGQQLVGTWPLRRLSGLIVMAQCNLSSKLLERCSSSGIPIAVTLRHGKQIAVLVPNQRSAHQAQHRHACWQEAQGLGARLALAQAVVAAKLNNYATLLRQREPRSPLQDSLAEAMYGAQRAPTTDALRGHEGQVARQMFRWLQQQVLPAQRACFTARRRERGAPDALNSTLNFLYYLLFTRLNAMVRLRGLNPYLGWLHDGDDDYETLVYDLMEVFRPFVDRLLLRLVNRQELRAHHFDNESGQHRLKRNAAREVAEAFERMLGEKVGSHRLRDLLWMQVRAVEELVAGRGPLWLFRWQLRTEPSTPGLNEPPLLTLGDDAWDNTDDETPDPADPLPAASVAS